MQVVVAWADDVATIFQARCYEVGEGLARKAFSMSMNKIGRSTTAHVRDALAQQTSIKRSRINASTKFVAAAPFRLETRIDGTGGAIPLIDFTTSQAEAGVAAFVWGRMQTYPSSFYAYGKSGVFKRLSAKCFPIRTLYGPAIPVELIKDASLDAFEEGFTKITREVDRILPLMLAGLM